MKGFSIAGGGCECVSMVTFLPYRRRGAAHPYDKVAAAGTSFTGYNNNNGQNAILLLILTSSKTLERSKKMSSLPPTVFSYQGKDNYATLISAYLHQNKNDFCEMCAVQKPFSQHANIAVFVYCVVIMPSVRPSNCGSKDHRNRIRARHALIVREGRRRQINSNRIEVSVVVSSHHSQLLWRNHSFKVS